MKSQYGVLISKTEKEYGVEIHQEVRDNVLSIKGTEAEFTKLRQATIIFMKELSATHVVLQMNIAQKYHPAVFGPQNINIRQIMHRTGTEIEPCTYKGGRTGMVCIKGHQPDAVFQARQLLIGYCPISLKFDINVNYILKEAFLDKLEKEFGVSIYIKSKSKQEAQMVTMRCQENNITNLYAARIRILSADKEQQYGSYSNSGISSTEANHLVTERYVDCPALMELLTGINSPTFVSNKAEQPATRPWSYSEICSNTNQRSSYGGQTSNIAITSGKNYSTIPQRSSIGNNTLVQMTYGGHSSRTAEHYSKETQVKVCQEPNENKMESNLTVSQGGSLNDGSQISPFYTEFDNSVDRIWFGTSRESSNFNMSSNSKTQRGNYEQKSILKQPSAGKKSIKNTSTVGFLETEGPRRPSRTRMDYEEKRMLAVRAKQAGADLKISEGFSISP